MIQGVLDLPVAGAVVPRTGAVLAGWVFNDAKGGQQPFSARVYASDGPTAVDVPIAVRVNAIERPDVQAAFSGVAEMSRYTGFQLTLGDLPLGPRTLSVEWADAYGAHYQHVAVVVE